MPLGIIDRGSIIRDWRHFRRTEPGEGGVDGPRETSCVWLGGPHWIAPRLVQSKYHTLTHVSNPSIKPKHQTHWISLDCISSCSNGAINPKAPDRVAVQTEGKVTFCVPCAALQSSPIIFGGVKKIKHLAQTVTHTFVIIACKILQ
jgi:hypothetical protein